MQRTGHECGKAGGCIGAVQAEFLEKVTTGFPDRAGMAGGSESTGCGI